MKNKPIKAFTFCILFFTKIYSASVVYNLRIAETTKNQAMADRSNHPFVEAMTLFEQPRKLQDGTKQNVIGGLETLIFNPKSFYTRIDFAIANVSERNGDYHFSRTQPDDILISFGYAHSINKCMRFTGSGYIGIPTNKDSNLIHIQFGTGHVGLGAQIDGSIMYSSKCKNGIMLAARIIHFFPRSIGLKINNQNKRFKLDVGNLVDLFIAHQSNFGIRHRLEFGYNPGFLFSASINPQIPNVDVASQINVIRSSFYASYRYGFLVSKLKSATTIGVSYGFDHKHLASNIKYAFTTWLSWGIVF